MRLYLVATLAACNYSPAENATDAPPSDGADGPLPDAGPCQAIDTTECVGDELRTCNVLGAQPSIKQCGWGCSNTGSPRCVEITPTGGAATSSDALPSTLVAQTDVVIPADSVINTTDGTIDSIAAGFSATPTTPNATTPAAMVFRFKSLTIAGPLKVEGTRALVLIADGPITVDGEIDTISCNVGGASVQLAGPGGGNGANDENTGFGLGGGGRAAANSGGAGGGGHGAVGGVGGDPATGGVAGPAYGDAVVSKLVGGSGGGGGRGGGGGLGGGGGAAIQLISNTGITIVGGINAGGCGGGGGGGGGSDGGGGGGSGGVIVLEAPSITITGALAVNGGGGGGSDSGGPGGNGTLTRVAAAGGSSGSSGADGGPGGAGASFVGQPGEDANLSSGGGGAVGRMRFNVRALPRLMIDAPDSLSPKLEDPASTTTTGTPALD